MTNRRSAGVPHATTEDDVYEGYFIPKGWYSQRTDLSFPSSNPYFRCNRGNEHMVRYLPYLSFTLVSNLFCRAALHDPATYPDPDSFKPERFINPDGSVIDDPVLAVGFGSGKRICPGRHLVDSTLFIVVASLLAVFNLRGNGTDKGPDAYPFTGSCLRCGHRVAFVAREKFGELTLFLVFRVLSPVPSPPGIEGQKSLSPPLPRHEELRGLSVLDGMLHSFHSGKVKFGDRICKSTAAPQL
jgi:hypothetical protein